MNADLGFVGVAAHKKSAAVAAPKKSVVEKRIIAMNMKQRPRAGNPYQTNPSEVPPIRSPPIFVHPPQPLPKLESPVRSTSEQLRYAGGEDYDYDEKYEKARAAKLEETPSLSSEDIYYVHAGSGDEFEYPEETAEAEAKAVKQADQNAADAKNKYRKWVKHEKEPEAWVTAPRNPIAHPQTRPPHHPDETCSAKDFVAQIGQPISMMGSERRDLATPAVPSHPTAPVATPVTAAPTPTAPLSFTEFMNMYQLYKEFTRSGTI